MFLGIKSSAFLRIEHPLCQQFEVQISSVWRIQFMKVMEFDLKWVHMARYELILRLDGALWLTIISKAPMTPKRAMEVHKFRKNPKCPYG